ncbi:hypothetical protein CJD36_012895 [Flavipsychrobacter stenotrophus]|uniref:TolC family protein n=1 Tax=Flavipsychrobacter stenotrophus TaxID=2077091 RepID=A0A2S7SV94_9BACT|nr:TolC family protein [Flavipsychrobacter stenotrophus]PQJ10862.1 hypothetical protein CJD36_012895 [Flavipsychrobacter stenotrophus]
MRRIYIALITLLAAGSAARAQDGATKNMSLQDCMDYAMKHNYSVKNAQLDVLIQNAQNNQTVSIALPQISGKADLNYFIAPQSSFLDASTFDRTIPPGTIVPIAFSLHYAASASVSASQILFDPSVAIALQARTALVDLSKQTGKVTEATVKYNVMKSYYSIIVAKNQLEILKTSMEIVRSMEHEMDVMKQTGVVEQIDVERNSVQVNNLVNDSIKIANLVTLTEQVLKYQMGMDINAPVVLTDNNLDAHIASSTTLLNEEQTYVKVPEYSLTLTGLKLNEYNLKRYKMAALPSLIAVGSFGYNYGENNFGKLFGFSNYKDYSLVGLQLNVPIFSGLKRTNQVKETQYNIEKAKNNIENLKLGLDFQTSQSKTSLRNAIIQYQSQKRNVTLAESVLDLARKKYKAGVGSNQEVTLAQTEQLRAQNSYFSTLIDIINAEADLKKALGQL